MRCYAFFDTQPPSKLHLTCRTLLCEATPLFYDSITFSLHFLIAEGGQTSDSTIGIRSKTSCTWLRNIRHLELRVWVGPARRALAETVEVIDMVLSKLNSDTTRTPELRFVRFSISNVFPAGAVDPVALALAEAQVHGKVRAQFLANMAAISEDLRTELLVNIGNGGVVVDRR